MYHRGSTELIKQASLREVERVIIEQFRIYLKSNNGGEVSNYSEITIRGSFRREDIIDYINVYLGLDSSLLSSYANEHYLTLDKGAMDIIMRKSSLKSNNFRSLP